MLLEGSAHESEASASSWCGIGNLLRMCQKTHAAIRSPIQTNLAEGVTDSDRYPYPVGLQTIACKLDAADPARLHATSRHKARILKVATTSSREIQQSPTTMMQNARLIEVASCWKNGAIGFSQQRCCCCCCCCCCCWQGDRYCSPSPCQGQIQMQRLPNSRAAGSPRA